MTAAFKTALVALAAALAACAPASLPEATSAAPSAGEVVVVGRIALDPPFYPDFERNRGDAPYLTIDTLGNVMFMAAGPVKRPLSADPSNMSQWEGSIRATPEQLFFVRAPRRRTWFNGAMIPLDPQGFERIYLPGGVFFDVPEGAEAVYIGTLLYHRTPFNEIKSAEIVDEYAQADAAFRAKFGAGAKLTPSLIQVPSNERMERLKSAFEKAVSKGDLQAE
jgi:hypothetical protein